MKGRGMGAATQGGGAVRSGAPNRVLRATSKTTGPEMLAKGGMASKKCNHGKNKTCSACS